MLTIHNASDRRTNSDTALRWVTFAGCASAVLYLCVSILRPFASVIAWSAVLAIICYPVHQRLARRTQRVAFSAFVISMLTVLACVVPLLLFGSIAVNQGVGLARSWQGAFNGPAAPLGRVAPPPAWITTRLGLDQAAFQLWIQQHVSELAQSVGRYAVSIVTGALGAVVSSV